MRKILYSFLMWLMLVAVAFGASQQTSSTTAQTIINNAKAILNANSDPIFSEAEMTVWLNDGQVDIAARAQCLQTTESVSLVADTIEYTITSQYATIKAVVYVDASGDSKGLELGSPFEVGNIPEAGVPVRYYEWAGKIGIYPALSSVTTETATLYLVKRPTAIIISANVTVPAIYDKALTYYIVAQSLWKDRQSARYAQMMQMYLQEISLYRIDLNEIRQEVER